MGTTQLELYNLALLECEHSQLASLTERGEARRILDSVYTTVVEECLEEADWIFANETIKLAADTGVAPNFGPTEVFAKPTDWIRTSAVSYDQDFVHPCTDYIDEGETFVANSTPLYLSYVSNDTGAGLDLVAWPRTFERYVALELAARICRRINQDKGLHDRIERRRDRAKLRAKNQNAMNRAQPKFFPPSSWNLSRGTGRRGSGRDRGLKDTLY